ncbi:MAG: hypothetical protein M3014_05800 [Chloroflexota bacterium]|nr:hypothetical protein [Chloroflexota bacterium]
MLLLSSAVMRQSFDEEYGEAAMSASRKIAGALPERLRREVRSLQESIQFIRADIFGPGPLSEVLAVVCRAIVKRLHVSFVYHSKSRA